MRESEIIEYAARLLEAHGDKAEFEAAQKARHFESQNNAAEAETWRKIRAAIRERRRSPVL